MKDQWLNITEIVALMDAFNQSGLGSLRMRNGNQEIALRARGSKITAVSATTVQSVMPAAGEDSGAQPVSGMVVKSPIVGTFYVSPSPEKPPFVKIGQQVRKGDVLFIIESMKLMNEVISEYDGIVKEMYVENAQTVEFGQPIMNIE